jgi:hypothetical protein
MAAQAPAGAAVTAAQRDVKAVLSVRMPLKLALDVLTLAMRISLRHAWHLLQGVSTHTPSLMQVSRPLAASHWQLPAAPSATAPAALMSQIWPALQLESLLRQHVAHGGMQGAA